MKVGSFFATGLLALLLLAFTVNGFLTLNNRGAVQGSRREPSLEKSPSISTTLVRDTPPSKSAEKLGQTNDQAQSSLLLLDPYSDQAVNILRNEIHLSSSQIASVQRLTNLVCDWNTRINLVSRKDCSPATVFSRHVLPSLAYHYGLPETATVMDVGTGGGFPGLVLAIKHPTCNFILLDAIGKKLIAVSDMVEQLGLKNVQAVHHGRVEDYPPHSVDIVTGRGLSDIRSFMGATQHLFRNNKNNSNNCRLLYWAGGDTGVEDENKWCRESPVVLRDRIPQVMDRSDDKRILTFDVAAVKALAKASGGSGGSGGQQQQQQQRQPQKSKRTTTTTRGGQQQQQRQPQSNATTVTTTTKTSSDKDKNNNRPERPLQKGVTAAVASKPARGSWAARRESSPEPKQRGYENFKRYDSAKGRTGGGTAD